MFEPIKKWLFSKSEPQVAHLDAAGLVEIRTRLREKLLEGFDTNEEIRESLVELMSDEYDLQQVEAAVDEAFPVVLQEYEAEVANWPEVTDCDLMDRAFGQLELRGIIARQNYSCCGNCGSGEAYAELEEGIQAGKSLRGYTFYHQQDTENAVEGGGVYLGYGAASSGKKASLEIAREIVEVLEQTGLTVRWDGSLRTRIFVKLDWKRRRISG